MLAQNDIREHPAVFGNLDLVLVAVAAVEGGGGDGNGLHLPTASGYFDVLHDPRLGPGTPWPLMRDFDGQRAVGDRGVTGLTKTPTGW